MFNQKLWKFFAPEAAAAAPAAAATPAAEPVAGAPPAAGREVADSGADVKDTSEFAVEDLRPGSKEYTEWQKTGKLPKAAPVAGDGEGAETISTEHEDSSTSTAVPAAGAQPAKPTDKGKKGETRYQELVEQLKAKDARIAELSRPKETAVTRQESQPATVTEVPEPTMDDVDKNGKFLYTTVADYNKARDSWLENRLLSKTEQNLEKRARERMTEQQAREINDKYRNRLDKAREKYADFDAVAMNEKLHIPEGSLMLNHIVLSEYGAEIAYLLGKNPAEAERIAKLNPFEQAQEMSLLELLAGRFDVIAKDPRFAGKFPQTPKPKKITAVPDSPIEIGGQGAVLPDEVEQAAANADKSDRSVREFIDAKNRRAIARRKGL